MTNIYIYCLFETTQINSFRGVYSSLKSVHRDALKLANRGDTQVIMYYENEKIDPTLKNLRNTFKGVCDEYVDFKTNRTVVTVFKTKLKE